MISTLFLVMSGALAAGIVAALTWSSSAGARRIALSAAFVACTAALLMSGAVLLGAPSWTYQVPRLLAPVGDVNDSLGLNPPELSPTQIQAKIDKDPVLWIAKIQALRNVGLEVLEVVKKKDVNALWQAGGDLDQACEACHLEYWYPGDKTTVLADRKARARFEKPRTPSTATKK